MAGFLVGGGQIFYVCLQNGCTLIGFFAHMECPLTIDYRMALVVRLSCLSRHECLSRRCAEFAFNDGKGVDGVVDGVAGGGVEEDGVCYSDL